MHTERLSCSDGTLLNGGTTTQSEAARDCSRLCHGNGEWFRFQLVPRERVVRLRDEGVGECGELGDESRSFNLSLRDFVVNFGAFEPF